MNGVAMAVEHDVLVLLLLGHRAMLLGYLSSFVRDAHLAEDLFQDISLVILKKGGDLADPSGFPVWSRRIARLEALNALRRRGKAPRPLDDAVLDVLDRQWSATDEAASPAADALRDCLQRMPPRSRQLVDLRYRDGISGKELADKVSQPLNTVYVTLARIHRALSECVKGRLAAGKAGHA
ncbi:MAG: sigma-70 family RNA polymerase sigma factor [Planctomycetes bacterium]|nr:sigma-70 family RNA polymerase sigma factor [Planctomycetota bacterium]